MSWNGTTLKYGLGYNLFKQATEAMKPPAPPDAPKPPTDLAPEPSEQDAAAKAKEAQTKRRRTLLASGGQTQLTGPTGAPVLASQRRTPTLLGG